MKSKEYMLQIKKLDKLIENKRFEADHWISVAGGCSTFQDGERVQSSGSKQKMADAVDRYLDIQAEITADIKRLISLKQEVVKTIEALPVDEYDVLHKIYVQNLTFQEVADVNEKSYSWATTIHGRALHSLQKILDEREINNNV